MDKLFDINKDGRSVRCKLYCDVPAAVQRVVVFCHGFGGHKDNSSAETFAHRIVAKWKGSAVIAFDWPCHGMDARKNLTLEDCDAYLGLVIDYARENFSTDELYAYGTSFGGYLLLKYLLDHGNPFRRLALRCPAVNMRETLLASIAEGDNLHKLESGKAALAGFDRKIKVTKALFDDFAAHDIREREFFDYADDIIILHGTADETVPCEDSRVFADANAIVFVPIEGADHRFHDPKKMDFADARILSFFREGE